MHEESRHLPFSAIVGQELFKTVYLANIVDPLIGGLLVAGAKGTGKSTMVHSVSTLLPEYQAVANCPFHCDPARVDRLCSLCGERPDRPVERMRMKILTLPLSCTEDRLIGSLDIEALLRERRRHVQPGILGEANRNLLYVDEVNLLPDHLVDDILDAAASHWSRIEREGVSVSHPAEFVLVGTMNPEEGELRPQILDRFPLSVKIETIRDPEKRAEIVRRNLAFERDPEGFHRRFAAAEEDLRRQILDARQRLEQIEIEDEMLLGIAQACTALKVDGQRPDIVIAKTARAVAALEARDRIAQENVLLAAQAALGHRTRDGGLLEPPSAEEIRDQFSAHLSR
ncbi:MAG: ATP-binding protein, partial [Candidatus Eisenbacteria bacterium]|nr:ATP-binding protein [Candidatus Eisenbacteria bacterium]